MSKLKSISAEDYAACLENIVTYTKYPHSATVFNALVNLIGLGCGNPETNTCWSPISEIACMAHLSESTTKRALATLIDTHWVYRTRRRYKTGVRKTNLYELREKVYL